ncbi:type IV pilus modification PilV family protein [Teredinibacter purpureus]|uniref:type IV pilus modification PilV family protein n=1 Tax=Teredinibacter purpureus TaxID=2731756 RepID=UPI0005F7BF73|nr:MSHA biogenesis protein MshD [Teredinibacter purpureus]
MINRTFSASRGVTLIETIFFLVIMSVALTALLLVFNESVVKSADPVVRVRAIEIAQAQLDDILSRKFDENTPTGGVPACDSPSGVACLGVAPDGSFNDVGDYNGFVDGSDPLYPVSVSVSAVSFGPTGAQVPARLITVTVGIPGGDALMLSTYRANF